MSRHRKRRWPREGWVPRPKPPKKRKDARPYEGPWVVRFSCGEKDFHPRATSKTIGPLALALHFRDHVNCQLKRFHRVLPS